MLPVMAFTGDLERFLSEDLYPYRYVIATALAALLLAGMVFAASRGFPRLLWDHRLATGLVAVPLLAASTVAGIYLLSPLWERSFLEEPNPLEAAQLTPPSTAGASSSPGQTRAGPSVTHRGEFEGADDFHFGRGQALLIRGEDGKYVDRFENFSVRNGPDLYVYLSRDVAGRKRDEALNLGRLKATDGAFNYELPPSIDLAGVNSVLVWCRQFSVLFASAELKK